jgi:hypothetical protein
MLGKILRVWLRRYVDLPMVVTQVPTKGGKGTQLGGDMPEQITISEAADRLGTKPYDVVRLIEAGHVAHVVLVDADSLTEYQEQQ